jgi:DNA repair photolyase
VTSTPTTQREQATRLLNINTIYYEPTVIEYPRGREILEQYPEADRIEVASHWNIPELHGNEEAVGDWNKIKRTVLVLGVKKSLSAKPYDRSSDFVAPSHANGCAMACAYCVVSGTLIATPQGQVPVEQIRDGDEVFAYDSSSGRLVVAVVSGIASREVDEVLEIQVGDTTLRVTAEHPIMTRRGWVKAGDLTEDDEVLCDDVREPSKLSYKTIKSIKRIQTTATVHNFHVPGQESYLANGVVTHNCYVARRKGFANPITTFVNIEQICGYLERHAARRGTKPQPTQADPTLWVYELGTNSDCSVDAAICDNLKDLIALFRKLPNAKATFATKYVNRDLLNYDPQGKTRIRFSLMPQSISQIVDVRTSKISDRINAVNDFLEAGYEVNLNFAPVIYYDNWLQDYQELFQLIDDTLSPQAKAQLQAEVVFLTHNEQLHEVNLGWHPQAEELLWRPDLQETKISGTGGKNLRYKRGFKRELVDTFCQLLATHLPYCSVRYAF